MISESLFKVNIQKIKFGRFQKLYTSGSYTLELADGGTQTIYYISDVNGHRVSIDKPFTSEEADNKPKTAGRRIDEPSEGEKEEIVEKKINEIHAEPQEEIKLVESKAEDQTEKNLERFVEEHTESAKNYDGMVKISDDEHTTEMMYDDDYEDIFDEA